MRVSTIPLLIVGLLMAVAVAVVVVNDDSRALGVSETSASDTSPGDDDGDVIVRSDDSGRDDRDGDQVHGDQEAALRDDDEIDDLDHGDDDDDDTDSDSGASGTFTGVSIDDDEATDISGAGDEDEDVDDEDTGNSVPGSDDD